MKTALLSTFVLGLIRGGYYYYDFSGGNYPVEEIRKVSSFVGENSRTDDKIFALEALWVVVEANRQTVQNMTMSQFSYYDGDVDEATNLNLVNDQIILDLIVNGTPKIVILTELDWAILRRNDKFGTILIALEKNYDLGNETTSFGQNRSIVQVYIRH